MKKILVISAALLAGCTTTTPEMAAVQVVGSPQAVAGCKYLRSVQGDQNLIGGVMLQGAAYKDAINQMKKQTVAVGGNRLYVTNATSGMGGATVMGAA